MKKKTKTKTEADPQNCPLVWSTHAYRERGGREGGTGPHAGAHTEKINDNKSSEMWERNSIFTACGNVNSHSFYKNQCRGSLQNQKWYYHIVQIQHS